MLGLHSINRAIDLRGHEWRLYSTLEPVTPGTDQDSTIRRCKTCHSSAPFLKVCIPSGRSRITANSFNPWFTPDPGNQMFKRWGFLIHGPHDNDQHDSSNGCPVFNKSIRNRIGKSNDKCFQVVP